MDHLVRDGDVARSLDDPVRVAVNGRHHRSGKAARDAADVQRQVLGTVERTVVVAVSAAAGGTDGRGSRDGGGRQRRHLAIGRIGNHPRAAVLRVVVLVPVRWTGARVVLGRAANRDGDTLGLRVAPLQELRELRRRDLFEALSRKLRGTLHRDPAFVAVVIRALKIRIAPRCFGRPLCLRERRQCECGRDGKRNEQAGEPGHGRAPLLREDSSTASVHRQ